MAGWMEDEAIQAAFNDLKTVAVQVAEVEQQQWVDSCHQQLSQRCPK
jgi:hypothetical protein